MGYLTTITIDNDDLGTIVKNSKEFCEKLEERACSMRPGNIKLKDVNVEAKVHKTKSRNDSTIYVHSGGTVKEITSYSEEAEDLMKNHPVFFKEILDYMKNEVEGLEVRFNMYQTKAKLE